MVNSNLKAGRIDARVSLTAGRIKDFPLCPPGEQAFLWDTDVRQLAVRSTGTTKAFIFKSTIKGASLRLTIGDVRDWTISKAREEARTLQTLIDQGIDPREVKKQQEAEKAATATRSSTTLSDAIKEYVKDKRRSKDNLPLKPRTKADYLGMIAPAKEFENGGKGQTGALYALADKSIYEITGDDIRAVHSAALKRGERQAAYSAQVLRALFNWFGVKVLGNPFDKDLPGRERIAIPQARATGEPIPAERIGAWWRSVDQASNPESRDYIKFLMLTGCRVSEPKQIKVADCDLIAGRVILRDTKNRKDHAILLSRQVFEIVKRSAEGKKPTDVLFALDNCKKTIATIERRSGTEFRLKDLRSTFASISGGLVSAYVLKSMMNHAGTGDVTAQHYIRLGDADLRAGWQAVADYIESKAAEEAPADVIDIDAARRAREAATAA